MKDNDFDVSVFIVTSERDVIYVEEFDLVDYPNPEFIMLTNDTLNNECDDNTIFIYKKLNVQRNKEWQIENVDIPNIKKVFISLTSEDIKAQMSIKEHLSGQRQTQDILLNIKDVSEKCYKRLKKQFQKENPNDYQRRYDFFKRIGYVPATLSAYNATVNFDGKSYHGYLPAIGQLVYISRNIVRIEYILKNIGYKAEYPFDDNLMLVDKKAEGFRYTWWSSTARLSFDLKDIEDMYAMGIYDGSVTYLQKSDAGNVLPLYALKI